MGEVQLEPKRRCSLHWMGKDPSIIEEDLVLRDLVSSPSRLIHCSTNFLVQTGFPELLSPGGHQNLLGGIYGRLL